ncbi:MULTISPECIES: ATP-binding protein [Zoogloea]|uniref:C4-dicarboxylate transport sensor protein DctB n=1 Tax=Zoogloea oleivorans TaxID=1552750 RepID=A0A6C2CLE8_9RHOO|nr:MULTISPECIES: ATP-binding protein [Zoogloea]MDD2668994.1 ATP-binding protein [Zoogloea sp.]TYC55007.1 sensor histidine kinase [Zoogloea oleivorans]
MSEPSSAPQTPPSRQLSPNPFIVAAFLLVIGLIGFGGYRASEYQGMQTLRTDAGHRLDLFAAAVDGIVNRYAHIPATIQLNEEVLNVMHKPRSAASVLAANRFLQRLNGHIGSIAIFVVDERGIVLASSNWDHPDDSFIGEDLSFRSYYLDGLAGRVGRHFAIGITRSEPGYFVSHPIRDGERVVGVAVIKISLGQLDKAWELLGAPALIADGNGVVILSSVPEWRYTALNPLPLDTLVDIKMSRLYNDGLIGDFPVRIDEAMGPEGQIVHMNLRQHPPRSRQDIAGSYLVHGRPLTELGWRLQIFSDLRPVRAQAFGHAALASVATGFVLLLLLVVAQRRRIIGQKLEAKTLLEQANAQLESKVARRTKALTDTNARLRKEVTERLQAEQTLRAAQDELVQAAKLAVLGQLAAGITHELAQPLGAMRTLSGNAIEFMKRGNLPTVEQNLGIIARLADQMGRIITPLKTFARKSPAIPAPADLAHAVGAALFLLDQRLAKADITVINRCEAGRDIAWCDQNRLEQVLINLIRNAADAMADAAHRELLIEAGPGEAGNIELSIADSGSGLPENGQLFEPFFTTKPAGEGLGLGLAISRDIVREFGGDLRAENRPAGGARFILQLPAAPKEKP